MATSLTTLPNPIPTEIFRAYDIRGRTPEPLSEAMMYAIGYALGRRCDIISVGRDGRLSGPALSRALRLGLQAANCKVVDVGMVPTPLVYYAGLKKTQGNSIAITGSHNPKDDNGLKITLNHTPFFGEDLQALAGELATLPLPKPNPDASVAHDVPHDIKPAYIDEVVATPLTRPLRVVADCGNGVAGVLARDLFTRLGAEPIMLFDAVDGTFPNHHPDPSKPENLTDAAAAVRAHNADIGLVFDGDGDRLGVIDSAGRILYADRLMMLFARDILERQRGAAIVFDVKCSHRLAEYIRAHGGTPILSATGHSFIKQRLKSENAALAGEMSGHIFFAAPWFGFDDALYAAVRLLHILANQEPSQTSAALFDRLPSAVSTPELNIALSEGEAHAIMRNIVAEYEQGAPTMPNATITTLDGLRIDFPYGWGLVRASNTTPVLVLRFEGDNEDALARIKRTFATVLKPHLATLPAFLDG